MEDLTANSRGMLGPGGILAMAVGAIALVGLSTLLTTKKGPQEPPFLASSIPIIGHLIRMFGEGADYYTTLYQQHHQGLYTLPIFRGRLYIVSSPEWAIAFNKAHKTLSFNAPVCQALKKLFLFDDATVRIVEENMDNEHGIMHAVHDMLVNTLRSGAGLDELNEGFLKQLTPQFQDFARNGHIEKVKLWDVVRHRFSVASMVAIYGPEHPFALNPGLVADFWQFEANLSSLFATPYPLILAPKVSGARQRMFSGMIEYANERRYEHASLMAKRRADMNLGWGLSREMHGKCEVSMMLAILANTVPSAFWLLSYIFADPCLLADVREEIDGATRVGTGDTHIINATKLKTECPLFFSAMKETLRMTASINACRIAVEDTPLRNARTGESYVLRKGSMVQMASTVIHSMSEVYGDDAATFNPRRWVGTTEKSADPAAPFRDLNGKLVAGSFRTFGGGNNICPGRHFAQTEMQSLAALFVAGFEIESEDGGQYVAPPFIKKKMPIAHQVTKPGSDVEVNVRRRVGYEATKWEFEM